MYQSTFNPRHSFLPGFPMGTRFPQFDSNNDGNVYTDPSFLDFTPMGNISGTNCKTPVSFPTTISSEASESQISSPASRPQSGMQTESNIMGPFHPPFLPRKPPSDKRVSGMEVFTSPLYNETPKSQDASYADLSQDPDGQLAEEVVNSVLQSPGSSKRRVSYGYQGIKTEPLDFPNSLFKQTWELLIDFANKSNKQWDLVFGSKSAVSVSPGSEHDINGFREVSHINDCSFRDIFDSLYSFIHVLYDFYQTRRHISISITVYEGLISDIRSIGKQFITFATANTREGSHKATALARTWELIDTLYVSRYRLEVKTSDRSIQNLNRLAAEKKAVFEMYIKAVEPYFILDHFRDYFDGYAETIEIEHLPYRKYGAKVILRTWDLCKALALNDSADDLVIDRVINLVFELKKIVVPYSLNMSWNFAAANGLARNIDPQAVKTVTENRALFPMRNEDFLGESSEGDTGNCSTIRSDSQQGHINGGGVIVDGVRAKAEETTSNGFATSRLQKHTSVQNSLEDQFKVTSAENQTGSPSNSAPSNLDENAQIYAIHLRILILACLKKHSSTNLVVQPPINIIRNTAYRLPRDILGRSGSSQDAAIQFRNAILDPNNLLSRGDKVLMEASVLELAKAVLWKCKEGRWQWLRDVFRDVVGLDPGQIPVSTSDAEGLGNGIGSRKISLI